MNLPPAIPTTTLRIKESTSYINLTDGGEADNLGIVTASAIQNDESRKKNSQSKHLLVLIDVFVAGGNAHEQDSDGPGTLTLASRA